jgi:sterol 14-demethylase
MTGEFAKVYHDLEAGLVPLGYVNPDLPLPSFRKRDQARVRMVEMITEVVHRRRQKNVVGEDFLQTLMESTYQNGQPLSEDEITGLLLAAIFAGHHTSSVTAAWTMIELLKNPSYLPPIVQELDRVYGQGQAVTYTSLRELQNLENAVREAGRLHPPLVILMRKLVADLHVGDFVVPKGTFAMVSPYVAHRIPEVFRDPDTFDPGRFDPGREEDKRSAALITFGAGRHKCLGMHFAHMQIKAFLGTLLRRYEISLVPGVSYEPDWTRLVVGPKQPCPIRYRRRSA